MIVRVVKMTFKPDAVEEFKAILRLLRKRLKLKMVADI